MSETLQVLGCIAAVGLVVAALLVPNRRLRAAAPLGALIIALALVAGQGWDELSSLRDSPAAFAGVLVAATAGLVGLAALVLRWPVLLPLGLVAALPFRIPIDVGGADDANLLVPLYAVIGAGVLATTWAAWRGRDLGAGRSRGSRAKQEPRALPMPFAIALAVALGLYALQVTYSNDVDFATRNVGFFLVPFAAMFVLLIEVRWTRPLLLQALAVMLGEALVLALIGLGQHVTSEIFWNPKLEMSNDFHFYFRVNSLFWDPNIFGRYLALAIVVAAGVLVWIEERRRAIGLGVVIALCFAGLLTAFSQTSFVSLLAGIAVLCALRWSLRWTAIAAPLVALVAVAGVLVVGDTSDRSAREVTEGHSTLIEGGLDLAKEEPLYGHGSASFSESFSEAEDVKKGETTSSHNEPITVAAEQGIIGLLGYAALLLASLWALFSGMRTIAPGLGGRFRPLDRGGEKTSLAAARVPVAAASCALLVHTIGYAGYLTDPLTWALLAIGLTLLLQTGPAQPLAWPPWGRASRRSSAARPRKR